MEKKLVDFQYDECENSKSSSETTTPTKKHNKKQKKQKNSVLNITPSIKKRKKKQKKQENKKISSKKEKKVKTPTSSSDSDDTNDFSTSDANSNENDNCTFIKTKKNTPIITSIKSCNAVIKPSSSSTMETNNNMDMAETSNHSVIKIFHRKDFIQLPEIEFQRIVLSYLQSIEVTYEQMDSKVNALLRHMNTAGIAPYTKPEELPELPLSTMEEFEKMEEVLAIEENFNYYVSINKCIRNF